MEWPAVTAPAVMVKTRPGRGRHRGDSNQAIYHQPIYYTDGNGLLVPTAAPPMYRTISNPGAQVFDPQTTAVVIHNTQIDDRSPSHSGNNSRRGSHGHDYRHDDSSSSDDGHRRSRRHRRQRAHSDTGRRYSPSPQRLNLALAKRLDKLKALEKKEEEEVAREKMRLEQIAKEAAEKKKQEQLVEDRKKYIEEWKATEAANKLKAEEKKKEDDKAFNERVKRTFGQAGYDEYTVETVLKRAEKGGKNHHRGSRHQLDLYGDDLLPNRPMLVDSKTISGETLDAFGYEWEYKHKDKKSILIKRMLPMDTVNVLIKHTDKLRQRKALNEAPMELRKQNGKLQLVDRTAKSPSRARSKSRTRSSWLFS